MNKKRIIIERTAKKLNMPELKVYQVVASFFEVVVEDIESEEYKGSYCRRLGKFVIKPNRLKMLKEKENGNTVQDSRWEGGDTPKLTNNTRAKGDLEKG